MKQAILPHSLRTGRRLPAVARTALLSALAGTAWSVSAASLNVQVSDAAGQPLADAAVYAEPASGPVSARSAKTVEIEQKGRKFLPPVTVIQSGTSVSFPNHDTVRHHVYSLSPAKMFDLKLYAGESPNPIGFDKPGIVVIGCNIHDKMVAYIIVAPTPYFGKTDAAGKIRLDDLPPGKYSLKAWHYDLPPGAAPSEQPLDLHGGGTADIAVAMTLNTKAR